MVRRWQELPLDRASAFSPQVRAASAALFALTAPGVPLPELGAAATMDQLRVAVFDACRAGLEDAALPRLVELRRGIG